MIRLAFAIHSNKTWLGGINVILNFIDSILILKNSRVKIVLITNSINKLKKFKLNKDIEIIEDINFFDQNIIKKFLDKISIIFNGRTIFLEKFLLKNKINYISHTTILTGNNSFTKSIIWIPDFQYLYFPNFFSIKYRRLKKLNINLYKKHAYKILLSSNDAKKDLKKLCNISNNKIIINKFNFSILDYKNLKNFEYLKKKYSLKNNFFYLPNQYWLHKNHKVVIKALHILKIKNNENIFVYSSGSKQDYRHPQNFKNLFSLVNKYKIKKNYMHLGLIPFNDVMSLIHHSLAVINPSYFEGWSSSVEQAKAYDKKIILSNIAVHKEQNPKFPYYFKPDDHVKLSKILLLINSKISKKHTLRKIKKLPDVSIKNYCKVVLNNNYN